MFLKHNRLEFAGNTKLRNDFMEKVTKEKTERREDVVLTLFIYFYIPPRAILSVLGSNIFLIICQKELSSDKCFGVGNGVDAVLAKGNKCSAINILLILLHSANCLYS